MFPAGYCPKKARLTLNAHQWVQMAEKDLAKSRFSAKKATRATRQLDLHRSLCVICEEQELSGRDNDWHLQRFKVIQ